jgi:reductive dehalogenase
VLPIALTFCAAAFGVFFLWIHFVSRGEREMTAARRSLLMGVLVPVPYLVTAWVAFPGAGIAGLLLLVLPLALGLVYLIPTGKPRNIADPVPSARLDERTIMFSRAALQPGSEHFENYYGDFPGHKANDDRFRALPGLMSPDSLKHEPLSFAAAGASFDAVEELAPLVTGAPAAEQVPVDQEEVTRFILGWAIKLGALDCGVTTVRDHHIYTIKGRGPDYGQDIDLLGTEGHRFAVAFTVEMDHDNLGAAPEGPTLMESAQQYLASGAIAVQIAAFIRRLGWKAEAHIDANYKVVCPLVARDAGLGEIGRMGLLMTPKLGPRVRIAVVTTDLPLNVSERVFDPTVLHFCGLCNKCADICPPRAIPAGPAEDVDGVARWQIDQEACFSYWCSVGTDCGQCVKVCPYSHPDNLLHNLVRWGLKRSWMFRHFALRMDDLLYGRRPGCLPPVAWIPRRKARPDGDCRAN